MKLDRPLTPRSTPKAAPKPAAAAPAKAATAPAPAAPAQGNGVTSYKVDFFDDSTEKKEIWAERGTQTPILTQGTDAWNPDPNNTIEAGKPFTIEYHRPGIMGHRDLTPEQVQANNDSMMDDGGMVYSPDYLAVQYTKFEVQYRINGGDVKTAELTEPAGNTGELTTRSVDLPIPAGASGRLEYWFKLTGNDGKTYYDSNFSQNYHGNIVPKDSIPTPLSFRGTAV